MTEQRLKEIEDWKDEHSSPQFIQELIDEVRFLQGRGRERPNKWTGMLALNEMEKIMTNYPEGHFDDETVQECIDEIRFLRAALADARKEFVEDRFEIPVSTVTLSGKPILVDNSPMANMVVEKL